MLLSINICLTQRLYTEGMQCILQLAAKICHPCCSLFDQKSKYWANRIFKKSAKVKGPVYNQPTEHTSSHPNVGTCWTPM